MCEFVCTLVKNAPHSLSRTPSGSAWPFHDSRYAYGLVGISSAIESKPVRRRHRMRDVFFRWGVQVVLWAYFELRTLFAFSSIVMARASGMREDDQENSSAKAWVPGALEQAPANASLGCASIVASSPLYEYHGATCTQCGLFGILTRACDASTNVHHLKRNKSRS